MRGSVVRRGNAVYVVVYQGYDSETGTRKYKWVSGFENEKQAQAFLVTVATSPAYGSGVGPRGSTRLRLGDFLDQWLRTDAKARCRPTELRRRQSIIRVHLKPRLGHVPLAKLAPATIQEYVTGLTCRSAWHIFKVLRAALNHAVRMDLILSNPCDRVTAPRQPRHKPTLWTVEETVRFLAECRRSSPRWYPLFMTEVSTGLRLGELLALQWRDVNLDAGRLYVTQGLDRPQGGGFTFGEPKSEKSHRPVRLSQEVVEELRAQRRRQVETRLRRGLCAKNGQCRDQQCALWHDHDLVFSQPNGKPHHGHNLTQRVMRGIIGRAGVPRIRFHDLRHGHDTLLAESGVSLRAIMERSGHSNEAFTLARYVHATPDMQEQAARVVSERLLSNQSLINPGRSGDPSANGANG